MSTPEDDRREPPAAWGDHSSEETQIVRPPSGGSEPPVVASDPRADPFSRPMPEVPSAPVGSRIADDGDTRVVEPVAAGPGGWNPSYFSPPAPDYAAQPTMTSVYPPSAPGYAPAGHPSAYAPPAQVPAPASGFVAAQPSSRVGPAFLTLLIGLILSAGGVYLGVRFGVAAAGDLSAGRASIRHSLLAAAGGIALFAALGLNGWSPWSTIIPGIGLTGIGGWTLFSASGVRHVADWTKSIFSGAQFTSWNITGFTLFVGLMLLGASLAATLARSSGKRDGSIIGSRRAS